MKFAAAVAILLVAAPLAAAAPAASKNVKPAPKAPAKTAAPASKAAPAKPAAVASAPIKTTTPIVETPRLRHETIGIQPGYGSIEADTAALARKDDDTALTRTLVSPTADARSAGPFAAVEAVVVKKKPQATGRIQVSFDVDRRGRVQRAFAVGIDKNLDRAIEAQLKKTVLPAEYAGQHVDTVLAFQKGKLLRR
jgi:hypothetical protein